MSLGLRSTDVVDYWTNSIFQNHFSITNCQLIRHRYSYYMQPPRALTCGKRWVSAPSHQPRSAWYFFEHFNIAPLFWAQHITLLFFFIAKEKGPTKCNRVSVLLLGNKIQSPSYDHVASLSTVLLYMITVLIFCLRLSDTKDWEQTTRQISSLILLFSHFDTKHTLFCNWNLPLPTAFRQWQQQQRQWHWRWWRSIHWPPYLQRMIAPPRGDAKEDRKNEEVQ